ncbi:MAG: hypothetical protein AAFP82_11930, partial [Bacteroidota bacterium]
MATEEKIMTLHPQAKAGVNILKRRYDFIKDFIIKTVEEYEEISYERLNDLASRSSFTVTIYHPTLPS